MPRTREQVLRDIRARLGQASSPKKKKRKPMSDEEKSYYLGSRLARRSKPFPKRAWTCKKCTLENRLNARVCAACGAPRPKGVVRSKKSSR